jgi:hypothetical protein
MMMEKTTMKKKPTPNETDVAASSDALRPGRGLVNTTSSPYANLLFCV